MFLDFWKIPQDSKRREVEGIYGSYIYTTTPANVTSSPMLKVLFSSLITRSSITPSLITASLINHSLINPSLNPLLLTPFSYKSLLLFTGGDAGH